jgi:hypothetical protein
MKRFLEADDRHQVKQFAQCLDDLICMLSAKWPIRQHRDALCPRATAQGDASSLASSRIAIDVDASFT